MEGKSEVSKKSGDFIYYADSYRNRVRSYRYKFSLHDPWRKKLHSLIFNDLMPLLVLIDKDWFALHMELKLSNEVLPAGSTGIYIDQNV